jgi:hypothetical protein
MCDRIIAYDCIDLETLVSDNLQSERRESTYSPKSHLGSNYQIYLLSCIEQEKV